MNMKNVLFIIGGLHGGGAEKALVELLANFDYERYHVTLCVVYYSGIYMSQIPEPVEVIYLYGEKRGYLRDSLKRKSFRYFLKKSKKRFFFGWLLSSADWSNCRSSSFCSRVRRVGVSTTTVSK